MNLTSSPHPSPISSPLNAMGQLLALECTKGTLRLIMSHSLTSPVSRWMISKACLTMRTVMSFLPLFRPCIIMELVRRSTMGHCALRKRLAA